MINVLERLCRGHDFRLEGDHVTVQFPGGRRQVVQVSERKDEFLLLSIVATPSRYEAVEGIDELLYERNRNSMLVGFRIDYRDRIVGESFIPKAGLSSEEFQLYLRHLARECDRFEFLITGKDIQ